MEQSRDRSDQPDEKMLGNHRKCDKSVRRNWHEEGPEPRQKLSDAVKNEAVKISQAK